MPGDPIITVERLSKRYLLGHQLDDTLRDRMARGVRSAAEWLRPGARRAGRSVEEFWALRDVSFELRRGQVLGIVGRNGAGKSTLLKILSRITEPTAGRVRMRGRVASLLEVGTGFHPELTGRENVYLNGAILGMSRAEITRKFDEIVAFSEIERFLDTPVKHYSSGMYVRLAFAIAAHLEPEILIVDEVLAVGDAQFQKKCLSKVSEVAQSDGRTILFVSHNSAALQSICSAGIWLSQGRLAGQGTINECLAAYLSTGSHQADFLAPAADRPHITSVRIDRGALAEGRIQVEVGFKSPFPLSPPVVGIILSTRLGHPISGSNGRMAGETWQPPPARAGVVTAHLDHVPLHSDTYLISVFLGDAGMDYDQKLDVVEFDFVSPRFHPQMPPLQVIGPGDFGWRWTLRAE
ncbi:MAG TPA: ABC transporter ATP-binding protein [Opitutaceae bacterium]|nr:ABC transporter ATP-binding protein [Opitutaceae bacterium]